MGTAWNPVLFQFSQMLREHFLRWPRNNVAQFGVAETAILRALIMIGFDLPRITSTVVLTRQSPSLIFIAVPLKQNQEPSDASDDTPQPLGMLDPVYLRERYRSFENCPVHSRSNVLRLKVQIRNERNEGGSK